MDLVPGAMSSKSDNKQTIIAFPGKDTGMVTIYHLDGKLVNIQAHKSELSGLALNRNGTLLATVSERGTLIRVFDTNTGNMKFEFRRGTTPTEI